MSEVPEERRIALVDLLDRVLAGGVVIVGDVVLSVADVDMVRISLRTLISSVRAIAEDQGIEQQGIEQQGIEGP
ncbi:gas vesicle protein GvpJ [Rhodococcus sp. NPDC003382]|uniref:gas vesicle protein GvpJ n=1 Tax=unclassified Rhodococcus (in: high G+C Gram-positive bacteria) TaxID=192944 RepID=UPI0018CFE4C5|nr:MULTISPECIES: gas vesicle protein GvpJ [unclassified Rhodococcus (in: high G+C Gram-positive bacteria)]MBH0118161.1 gas vesicle protein [Rhodococcus sp. CX]MCK8673997.1 gas vesicle protein [Rhodococcus sp. HM1]